MPIFKNPKIKTIGGVPTVTEGFILVPNAQNLNQLFQEFNTATSPVYPPTTPEEANQILKNFAIWCSSVKGYTVVKDTEVFL